MCLHVLKFHIMFLICYTTILYDDLACASGIYSYASLICFLLLGYDYLDYASSLYSYAYLTMIPLSFLDKYFMLTFGSIRSLWFHWWKYWRVSFMLIIILTTLFSLLDKYFMLPFGSIRSVRFHTWKYWRIIYMILIMLPTLFSLIDEYLCFCLEA